MGLRTREVSGYPFPYVLVTQLPPCAVSTCVLLPSLGGRFISVNAFLAIFAFFPFLPFFGGADGLAIAAFLLYHLLTWPPTRGGRD